MKTNTWPSNTAWLLLTRETNMLKLFCSFTNSAYPFNWSRTIHQTTKGWQTFTFSGLFNFCAHYFCACGVMKWLYISCNLAVFEYVCTVCVFYWPNYFWFHMCMFVVYCMLGSFICIGCIWMKYQCTQWKLVIGTNNFNRTQVSIIEALQ